MGLVFVTNRSDAVREEISEAPFARITFGGAYFFLYPSLQHLRDQTGQLIDPQLDAFFDGPALGHLDSFLGAAESLTAAQPETWQQRVGIRVRTGDVEYETTQRHKVAQLIGALRAAVVVAQQRRHGVLFWGE